MLHHVGPPLPCCEVKLIDVPEMNYFAKDGKGEVRAWHPLLKSRPCANFLWPFKSSSCKYAGSASDR
jgi:hypothetical protein